jgi:lipopolysaccharide biosynthesis glycosyltransferase
MSRYNLVLFLVAVLAISWLTSSLQTSIIMTDETLNMEKYINITTHETIRNSQFNEGLAQYIRKTNQQESNKAEFCKIHLENSIDPIAIHEDYVCLSKSELDAGNITNAIYFLSKAQDLVYLEKTELALNSLMGSSANLSTLQLQEIANNEMSPYFGLVNYRLSIIHQLGRTDARFERAIDIKKAFEHRKKADKALAFKNKSELNIAMIFDSKYHKYAINSILSMLLSSRPDSHYNYFIIHDDTSLNNQEIDQLKQLKEIINFSINFIKIDENSIKGKQFYNLESKRLDRFSKYSLWRIYLHHFLQLERVIYIDPDTIILSDLTPLFNYDLQDNLIAAVPDWGQYFLNSKRESNLYTTYPYFNSGIMLMALQKIKNTKIIDEYQCSAFDSSFPDQDVLNMVFRTRTSFLGYNWNRLTLNSRIYYRDILPNIIHFSGIFKPDKKDSKNYLFPEYLEFYKSFDSFKNTLF